MTKFHAYVKRTGGDDWGKNMTAKTERSAKAEARKTFGGDYRDATIYLCEWYDGVLIPVAAAPVAGGKWVDATP